MGRKLLRAVALLLIAPLLAACPSGSGTVVRKQHQVPDGKDIRVERWCLHVQPPNPDTKPLIFCRDDRKEYDRYKVGDRHPR